MALNNEYPIVNGIAPSWADIVVKASPEGAALVDLKDIAAISTARTVEVGEQRGASGGRVMRRTTGSVSYEMSITFYRSGFQKFLRALAAIAPTRGNQKAISLVHFGVTIQHTPQGDDEVYERRCKGCRVLTDTLDSAEGTEADQVEVSISVVEIVDVVDGAEVTML